MLFSTAHSLLNRGAVETFEPNQTQVSGSFPVPVWNIENAVKTLKNILQKFIIKIFEKAFFISGAMHITLKFIMLQGNISSFNKKMCFVYCEIIKFVTVL